jgi:hypothetical protein
MKTLLISMLLLISIAGSTQNVSVFAGASTNENVMYGIEFKSKTVGLFVERYVCEKDYLKYILPKGQLKPSAPDNVLYDGIMFGANTHIKALSNILLSAGVGVLNEYTIYTEGYDGVMITTMKTSQKFALEISAGKDFNVSKYVTIGVKGGVNNCALIFGTVSLGVKLDH